METTSPEHVKHRRSSVTRRERPWRALPREPRRRCGCLRIALPEFLVNAARLMRPVSWEASMAAAEGFPGWVPLASGDAADVNALVSTLQTGDVLLSALDDDMGRYIQFAMDSPWSHAAVVLRLGDSAAGGVPNDKTEALLRKYPFRRRSHKFCAPGYCRCFDWAKDTAFAASCLKCPSGVLVLESTGEAGVANGPGTGAVAVLGGSAGSLRRRGLVHSPRGRGAGLGGLFAVRRRRRRPRAACSSERRTGGGAAVL